jgi:hypothetical protein
VRFRHSLATTAERGVRALRDARLMVRHLRSLVREGQLRFRMETFGLYYPAPPYGRPWWKLSPGPVALLVRRARSYGEWVIAMEKIRSEGHAAWWETHGGPPRREPE